MSRDGNEIAPRGIRTDIFTNSTAFLASSTIPEATSSIKSQSDVLAMGDPCAVNCISRCFPPTLANASATTRALPRCASIHLVVRCECDLRQPDSRSIPICSNATNENRCHQSSSHTSHLRHSNVIAAKTFRNSGALHLSNRATETKKSHPAWLCHGETISELNPMPDQSNARSSACTPCLASPSPPTMKRKGLLRG